MQRKLPGGAELVKRLGAKGFDPGMPAFDDMLSDAEIWNIVTYIHDQWPEEIRALQASRNPPHE
ncbi:c-type cytochrome [Sagittula stellata]|uniref:c-type cytochrome n=1 Tax=Sagittula stellata TaxID=52603 RepID=UPI0012F47CC1|nr:cytochrome c [Sagittula stellata]